MSGVCARCKKSTVLLKGALCYKCDARAVIEAGRGKGTCPICGIRPKRKGSLYCTPCSKLVTANQPVAAERPFAYVTWKGMTAAIYRRTGGTFTVEPFGGTPPKGKVVNLNTFVTGYTRPQVKAIKAAVLRACEVKYERVKVV